MQGLSFETARGTVHAWQCDHMGHANLRAYGVQQSINYRKMRHEMQHVETGEVCATCELTAVCIDAKTRKPREFPPEISSKAKEIL